MTCDSTESRTRKYVKGYNFSLFERNLSNKSQKQLLDTGLDSLKTFPKKLVLKAREFIGNKITEAVAISYVNKILKPDENLRNVEEIIIPPEKRKKLNELRQVL